jgi:malonate-semialdehyde dehydrogenase (acetylating)/methylmalonate-semialdehyde dehydrogenase
MLHTAPFPQPPSIGHYTVGAPLCPDSARTRPIISPVDGAPLGLLAIADAAQVDSIAQRAHAAFQAWGRTPVKERVQPLFRFKHLVEQNLTRLAATASHESGKTLDEAAAGIQRGLEVVEYACAAPALLAGDLLEVSPGVDCHTRRYPLGVVAGITPFNFPAMVPMWMFPMAIACGNTFILKPSEQVPRTPLRLAELLTEAGLPDGVFNIVQGDRETVEAILDHPLIRACAFVGSTPVAQSVFERGQAHGKRMLTLGGAKNHVVILPDADPVLVAKNVAASATGCAGQRCMAASVAIAVGPCDAIIDAIAHEMHRIRAGYEMGAIINTTARDRILRYIDSAENEGAALLVDGRHPALPEEKLNGYYVGATLIDRLSPDSKCVQEEIFGPVLSILRVKTLDEALDIENRSPYGNAASIYTSSGAAARHFEQRASAGMIGINIGVPVPRDPFSFGGWNESKFGIGDITGRDAIGFWTQSKKTTVKWSATAAKNWMT